MATQNQNIDFDWTDVKSTLSLSDAQKYTLQNTGSFECVLIEAASEPSPQENGHKIVPNGLISVTPDAGLNLYVRLKSEALGKTILTVTEAE